MKICKKVISVFLAILTILSVTSTSISVFAAEYTENQRRAEYFDSSLSGYLKEIVNIEDAVSIVEKDEVEETIDEFNDSKSTEVQTFSMTASQTQSDTSSDEIKEAVDNLDIDHSRLTLKLEDGSETAYMFSEPVSFIDENGELIYKDTNIKEITDNSLINNGFAFENGANDYKAYFGKMSSRGVLFNSPNGSSVKLVPMSDVASQGQIVKLQEDGKELDALLYSKVYDDVSSLRYTPQLNGVKEEIVVNSYTGKNTYEFMLYTGNDIAAVNSYGDIEIIDKDTKAILDTFKAPFAYDSSEGFDETSVHYTDCKYVLEEITDGEYKLSVVVPEEYLVAETTQYPIVIDPTTDSISMTYDTAVYSAKSTSTQSSNPTACFGKTGTSEYGKGRAMFYFKIPSDIEKYAKISSAKLWLRETTARSTTMYVRPYLIKDSWNNSVTWDTMPSYYNGTADYPGKSNFSLPRRNINSQSTDSDASSYWYAFNIVYALRAWTTGTANRGLMFIAECEADDGDYLWRAFATKDNSTSSYRPYVVISYTNDTTKPTIESVTGNPTEWTNSNVKLTVTATDNVYGDDGIAYYSFDNGETWQTKNYKLFSSNQTVYIKVKDLAGNISSTKTVKITKIDKTAPSATITLSPTTWTNGSVTATIKMTDNSAIAKYTINGTTTTLDADGSEAITSKTVTKTYSADTTVSITVYDAVGNSKTVSKAFTNIDKIKPVISSVSGNPTDWTSSDVTLTVTATDEESGIAAYSFSNASGTYNWQTGNSKTFTKNQTVYIYVKDNAGNISIVKTVSITKFDKTVPTASVTSTATSASAKVTITASDSLSGLHSTPYSFDGGITWQTDNTKVVTSTSTLSIKVRDKVGNIKTLSHTPSETLPITIIPSPTGWTNGNVRLTVTGTGISQYKFVSGTYTNVNYHDYSENMTAFIVVRDNNGIEKVLTFDIENIDKVAPSILSVDVTPETDYTNHPVTVSVSANDELSGVAEYSFDGGTTWQSENSVTFTANTPKTVTVKVKDNAGNVTQWDNEIELPSVDNISPDTPDLYEQDGLVYISSRSFDFDEATDSPEYVEYNINGDEWKTYDEPLEAVCTADTTIYARVRDEAGNVSEEASVVLKSTLGEYTTSYTDIALGEGLFPVPFERTYTSTSGWFFTFEANITEYTNGYVFTDFYGEKQYFIKNGEDKYLSANGEELTVNAKSYLLTYGDMTCTFNSDGKIIQIKTDYLDTTYTWSENTLVIDGDVTVTFTNGKVTKINITRTDNTGKVHTKETEYVWAEGNLTKFTDAAGYEHTYAYTNGLLTKNETETIDYSAQGRVKRITQQNGAFVKYTYDDTAQSSENTNYVGTVTVSDSKGVTDVWHYADGVYVSNTLDSYSDSAVYTPESISNALTNDNVSNVFYLIEETQESGSFESANTENDNTENADGDTPLYEETSDNSYAFYKYDNQDRVTAELEVLKANIADITNATFESVKEVACTKIIYVYASSADNTITDKYIYTYTEDNKLATEKYYAADESNVLCLVSEYVYNTDENIISEIYYTQETVNEEKVDVICESYTREYCGENMKSEIYRKRVDIELVNQEKTVYSYDDKRNVVNESVCQWISNAWYQTYCEEYTYDNYDNVLSQTISEYKNTVNSETGLVETTSDIVTVTYEYDVWCQQVKVTESVNATENTITTVVYDALGRVVSVAEDDELTAYTYDSKDNILTVTEGEEVTTYTYENGNLVSRTNPNGTVASYVYDAYGNLANHAFNGYAFTYNTLGSILTANSESGQLVNYTYSSTVEQDVLNANFGNGQSIVYDYNEDGEITAIKLGEETKYGYEYFETTDENGEVTKEWTELTDYVSVIKKVIEESKLTVNDLNGNFIYSVENVSADEDVENSFDGTVTTIGSDVYTLVTEENKDTFKTNGTTDFTKEYTYVNDELSKTQTAGITTTYGYNSESLVSVLENTLNALSQVYGYGYDKNGNITTETLTTTSKDENGATIETNEAIHYTYDDKEQLISAETSSIKYEYTYDDRGNILTKKEYSISLDKNNEKVYTLIENGTDNYVYDETWKDQLISYNGQSITYDEVGNPTNYMGNALTWTMGRELASFGNISYTYNEDGIRTSKTSNGVTTKFYLDGNNIIEQTDGTTTLHFFYDSNGEIIGFRYNGNDYFYVKNVMGDIIAITDSNKNIVAEYRYDPWGKVLNEDKLTVIGALNPFRYRSYYYDNDIQMYYLQSRYYDAEVGRFINCDDVSYIGITELELSYNAFAYCENEPINCVDLFGKAKTYQTVSKKNNNLDYIVNAAIKLYENSKIYRKSYITNKVLVNQRYKTVKIATFIPKYIYQNNKKIYRLQYVSSHINTRNQMYYVLFSCMTVDEWSAYIVGKHKIKLLSKKEAIEEKYGLYSDVTDTILDLAEELVGIVAAVYTGDVYMYEQAKQVFNKIRNYSEYLEILLSLCEKYRDKEDRYITSILKKYSNNKSNVLILLSRLDYAYTTRSYQRGIYWVCQTGWFSQKRVNVY